MEQWRKGSLGILIFIAGVWTGILVGKLSDYSASVRATSEPLFGLDWLIVPFFAFSAVGVTFFGLSVIGLARLYIRLNGR